MPAGPGRPNNDNGTTNHAIHIKNTSHIYKNVPYSLLRQSGVARLLKKTIGVMDPETITPQFCYKTPIKTSGVMPFPVFNIQSYLKTGNNITPRPADPPESLNSFR